MFDGAGQSDMQSAIAAALRVALDSSGLGDLEPCAAMCEAEVDLETRRVTMLVEIDLRPRRAADVPASGMN